MQSHYPMTASRPGCTHNYFSVAACVSLTAGCNDKSHALAWWMTDRLSVHLLSFFFLLFYEAVIWIYWNAVSLLGAVLVCQPQSKIQSKSSHSVRKGVSSRPVHPRIRQSCGFMSESYGSYLQKRSPGLQMTLVLSWKLLKVAQLFDFDLNWRSLCFRFVWP